MTKVIKSHWDEMRQQQREFLVHSGLSEKRIEQFMDNPWMFELFFETAFLIDAISPLLHRDNKTKHD